MTLIFTIYFSLLCGTGSADQTQAPQTPKAPSVSKAAGPTVRYHRFICLVHLTGSGTKDDPRLPEYAPASIDPGRSGIIAWSMQLTDDKEMAIVHYVAADRRAFERILADKRSEIRVFEIGKDKPEEVEKEMRKYKKDFTLDSLQVVAQ